MLYLDTTFVYTYEIDHLNGLQSEQKDYII